ncbi:MAG: glycolate oxidase subunit GlcE, partial [Mariprofundaceae bacterium]|nr:glycolate oxidase subunit GlcE [Mariprofundaceae bacterium]
MTDATQELQQAVQAAYDTNTALEIRGNHSKAWYGREATGQILNVGQHQGILNYQPSELIITARAGTKLTDIAQALDEHEQRLPFDPPYFGENATLGGTIACNFSGPRRPYAGSARDMMLGCRLINGKAEVLRFGGEVMKNVAGFDVSRLMAGSLGTLAVMLDISLKVLPHRQAEQTVVINTALPESISLMNKWASSPLPITAMCAHAGLVYFRICGTASSVQRSMREIGGQIDDDGLRFWKSVREHQHEFFAGDRPLYRLSVPAAAAFSLLDGTTEADWFIGWGGAQRW